MTKSHFKVEILKIAIIISTMKSISKQVHCCWGRLWTLPGPRHVSFSGETEVFTTELGDQSCSPDAVPECEG